MNKLLDIAISGGPVMIPLGICSVAALAIIINRYIGQSRPRKVLPPELLQEVLRLIRGGHFEQALSRCQTQPCPLSRVLSAVIEHRDYGKIEMIRVAEHAGRVEGRVLIHSLGPLNTIVSISPLLGLLGTVIGMIRAFYVVSAGGIGDPSQLSGGIAEALIATAAGLVIAIPALVFYRHFLAQARMIIGELEEAAMETVNSSVLRKEYEDGLSKRSNDGSSSR